MGTAGGGKRAGDSSPGPTTLMSDAPLILLTNDDGHLSEGIDAAWEALEGLGDLWMMAPERERSAVGHSISLHKPLRIGSTGPQRMWCSGTPTDCVFVAVHHELPRPPALVVSGINRGANLGDDVTYSGTVAAAMEAALLGIPAIAASLTGIRDGMDFDGAKVLLRALATDALRHGTGDGTLLNLNVPTGYDPALGMRATRLGRRHYGRDVVEKQDPRGRRYLWIGGTGPVYLPLEGSDVTADHEGIASVTPLHVNWTDVEQRDAIARWPSIAGGDR